LARDDSIRKTEASYDSYTPSFYLYKKAKDIYRIVKDGKLLKQWEPFAIPVGQ
jgi:hypothetical protein